MTEQTDFAAELLNVNSYNDVDDATLLEASRLLQRLIVKRKIEEMETSFAEHLLPAKVEEFILNHVMTNEKYLLDAWRQSADDDGADKDEG